MYLPDISGSRYVTDPLRFRRFSNSPTAFRHFLFYSQYFLLVIWCAIKFLFIRNPQAAIALQSLKLLRNVEKQGVHITIDGLDRYPADGAPYVFACNHMGTLEANVLPGIIASRIPMTFVIKKNLLRVPFFGQLLKRLDAIPVTREHPGEDLMKVLEKGAEILGRGISVILFPEGSRQEVFSARKFNTLAIKLALKADVAVVPVALRTDFWGIGKHRSYLGPLRFDAPVKIAFGNPIRPSGRGKDEHRQVLDFIHKHLREWGFPVEDRVKSV